MSEPNDSKSHPDRVFEADAFAEVATDAAVTQAAVVPPSPPSECFTESADSLQIIDVRAEPLDGA